MVKEYIFLCGSGIVEAMNLPTRIELQYSYMHKRDTFHRKSAGYTDLSFPINCSQNVVGVVSVFC
jgi:hypothetical protein